MKKSHWKTAVWIVTVSVLVVLELALLLSMMALWMGMLPVYGENCVMWGRLLLLTALVGAIVFFPIWAREYGRLRRRLIADYGEKCMAPIPKSAVEEEQDEI